MKQCYPALLILSFLLLFSSCKEEVAQPVKPDQTQLAIQQLKQTNLLEQENPDPEQRLNHWRQRLDSTAYNRNRVLLAMIHYNMAGEFYKLQDTDSMKAHMQQAWLLMGDQSGFPEVKILLYCGLAHVAGEEHKSHQENYYYNQAARMLIADSAIDMTIATRVNIFLSAAQSAQTLRQYGNAFDMNYHALQLLPQFPEQYATQFRIYSQLALCHGSVDQTDSMYTYIKKMEHLHHLHPEDDGFNKFLNGRKARYFQEKGMLDSSLVCTRNELALDETWIKQEGSQAGSTLVSNLYMDYCCMADIFRIKNIPDSTVHYLRQCDLLEARYPQSVNEKAKIMYRENLVYYLLATQQNRQVIPALDSFLNQQESLYENENAQAVAEMATIYQLQAKDKSIHHLSQTVDDTQDRLQRNRLLLVITALVALLAIAISVVLYFAQKQRKLRQEKEKIELQQRLLRTQMEPHFIFNTLSALQSFVRFDEKEKTLKYLSQFGLLLRSSLELSRESLVPLDEEIATLDNYLSLQQMRYEDGFDYSIEVQDEESDTGSVYIPPMLIQPFVENAIQHGLEPKQKKGRIRITFRIEGKMLQVSITDNGKGMAGLPGNTKHRSLSTTISKERLEILARESRQQAGMRIKSQVGAGTTVTLTIPLKAVHELEPKDHSDNKTHQTDN